MGRDWKNLEVHARNMNVKGDSSEVSEERQECKESLSLFREYINDHEHNVGRNIDDQGHSHEFSDRNEKHIIGN